VTLSSKQKHLFAIGLALFFILTVIFLPKILSTTMGKSFVTRSLSTKTGAKAEIDKLHLSWFGPQKISKLTLKSSNLQGSIESLQANIPLWKLHGLLEPEKIVRLRGNFNLQNGSFRFQSETVSEASLQEVNASFKLQEGSADFTVTGSSQQGQQNGSFSIQGQLSNFFAPVPNFSVQAEISAFPTLALARYLAIDYKLDERALLEIVGTSFHLQGSASLQNQSGTCDLSLHAPNGDAEIRGKLDNQVLTLEGPLLATIRLTPALSQRLLKGINPLFLTGIEAKNPIQLRIEPSKFRLFLGLPFQWNNLKIGRATLDVGKIRCSNGSTLGTLISLLKNGSLSRTREMEVWFTPLFFKLENGVVQTGRMDALAASSIRFCTWGDMDLSKNRIKMILGLTADTLKNAFGLKKLSNDYVLKIPITGTIEQPKLDTGSAAAKIAAMLATEHAPGGGILNIFLQPEKDVPPPNKPFPWER